MGKEPRTLEEQLQILRSRGVKMEGDEYNKASDILKRTGYYKLINGYKKLFIKTIEDEPNGIIEEYKNGTTISEIYSLFYFDRNLREVMLRHILPVEIHIKSLLSFVISDNYGNDNYLKFQNFNTDRANAEKMITGVISDIHKQISARYTDPSIKHYLTKYGFLPMWVLNNILTMGNVSKLYSVMKPADQQTISRAFGIQESLLSNFLRYLTDIRNFSAHGNRLYCYRSRHPLSDTPVHANLPVARGPGEYRYGKRDLFAACVALKYLTSNNDSERLVDEINYAINGLRPHLHTITTDDVLGEMGFPENWWKIKFRDIK